MLIRQLIDLEREIRDENSFSSLEEFLEYEKCLKNRLNGEDIHESEKINKIKNQEILIKLKNQLESN